MKLYSCVRLDKDSLLKLHLHSILGQFVVFEKTDFRDQSFFPFLLLCWICIDLVFNALHDLIKWNTPMAVII